MESVPGRGLLKHLPKAGVTYNNWPAVQDLKQSYHNLSNYNLGMQ